MNDVAIIIERLFQRHYRRMFLTACALLGNDEEARDAVSEVFLYLLSARWTPEEQRAEAWLLVAVRNHCLNLLKHWRVTGEYPSRPPRREGETAGDVKSVDDANADVDSLYAEIERYIQEEVTEPIATVVSMRYMEQRRAEDIATELGLKRATVYQRLKKGINQIRNHFKER